MQTAAVGWQLYELTNSAYVLGGVGLVQVLPLILFALPAGHVADRYDRRHIILFAEVLLAGGALGLAGISLAGRTEKMWMGVALIYVCLFMSGVARAFEGPARAALLPQIVPRGVFTNAVTWASGGFQLASVIGPALGGLLIAQLGGATFVYVINAGFSLVFFALLTTISGSEVLLPTHAATLDRLAAGLRFVWRTRVVLAAITLDLFAVLLGGATTLLPVYAKDILHVDAAGLGWLLAATPAGAVAMVLLLAFRPPFRLTGGTLLWAVAIFGACTIFFGLSNSFMFSLLWLFLLGAADQISVVIRSTLVQTKTPNELRGRVSAVNGMFVGTSNELGGFESGFVAGLVGPVATVVGGGVGTLIVVGLVALLVPQLRRMKRLDVDHHEP